MAASVNSNMQVEDDDLEDGEIEDDDEEEIVKEVAPTISKPTPAVISPEVAKIIAPKKAVAESSGSSSSNKKQAQKRKDKVVQHDDDDDFMSNIELQIASVLKKEGIEVPMPNIRKQTNEVEQENERKQGRNSRKRKKRRQNAKKDGSISKKRSKLADSDNLYMVGGSPDHQQHSESESDDAETSYSSYDSDEYHRSTHEERRNKRRDKYSSRAERERDRERERERDRERDRDRDRRDRRNRDIEKEVCLRFAEFGHCPEEDCQRAHEVRQPKKMELCKFWLMECCAKKDKCSYMHGDFPCKFYYLGLKCVNKDCKFSHGKPLSDNLKNILLKHLDTAPKEILGDFPRIGRENATKMLAQTHIKLCEEFNIPLPESETKSAPKIPSLLELDLKTPNSRKDRNANPRWVNRDRGENNSPARNSPPTTPFSPGDVLLAELKSILSDKQVESMSALGVKTVNDINNMTVAQLNDLGLTLATIGEIQATAINMSNNKNEPPASPKVATSTITSNEDVDLRRPDIDMRVYPSESNVIKSPDTIMSPTQSDAEIQEVYKKPHDILHSPPLDYSQYLRDSNLNDDENEDEPSLKIDETYGSDYDGEEKKDSQSEDDQKNEEITPTTSGMLLPPAIDTSAFLKMMPAKVDLSSSIQQLMEKEKPSRDPRSRDPRAAKMSPARENKIPEISSPTYRDPRQQQPVDTPRRTSIYEIESPSEDEDIQIKLSKDKDMRMPFMRDAENGDIDFRLPFAPMANYVPATEIDASYGIHHFDKYEVKIVDIPRPDYSDIRRSFKQVEHTQDPRLKKLCATHDDEKPKASLSNITLPSDPRKRKAQAETQPAAPQPQNTINSILQNSKHYHELSSSQKMVVNDVLSELSKQLKIFHADQSPSKIFDTTIISTNPRLQQILIGLGVFVNAQGEFEEIKDFPSLTNPPPQVVSIPNIHQMPPTIIPSLLQQPPPNLPSLMLQPPPNFLPRPGILGMAPFDTFNQLNAQAQQPFGNEQNNFNRNQRQQQSNNNNNFRNNSHRNSNSSNSNNNYRGGNRR